MALLNGGSLELTFTVLLYIYNLFYFDKNKLFYFRQHFRQHFRHDFIIFR